MRNTRRRASYRYGDGSGGASRAGKGNPSAAVKLKFIHGHRTPAPVHNRRERDVDRPRPRASGKSDAWRNRDIRRGEIARSRGPTPRTIRRVNLDQTGMAHAAKRGFRGRVEAVNARKAFIQRNQGQACRGASRYVSKASRIIALNGVEQELGRRGFEYLPKAFARASV